MWLLNSYKVTIMDVVKNCQEKIEYAGKLQQGLQILLMRLSGSPLVLFFLNKGDSCMLLASASNRPSLTSRSGASSPTFDQLGYYFSKLVMPVNNLPLIMPFTSMH